MACESRWITPTDEDHFNLDSLSDSGLENLMAGCAWALAERGYAIQGVELGESGED